MMRNMHVQSTLITINHLNVKKRIFGTLKRNYSLEIKQKGPFSIMKLIMMTRAITNSWLPLFIDLYLCYIWRERNKPSFYPTPPPSGPFLHYNICLAGFLELLIKYYFYYIK